MSRGKKKGTAGVEEPARREVEGGLGGKERSFPVRGGLGRWKTSKAPGMCEFPSAF